MRHIFVWTIGDVFGLIFIGLLILVGAMIQIAKWLDRFDSWRHRRKAERP